MLVSKVSSRKCQLYFSKTFSVDSIELQEESAVVNEEEKSNDEHNIEKKPRLKSRRKILPSNMEKPKPVIYILFYVSRVKKFGEI